MRIRTQVHSPMQASKQRSRSRAHAYRMMVSIMMLCQMLLWVTFFGYDKAQQAVWQAALLLVIPSAALYLLWKRMDEGANPLFALPLLLCLLLDVAFLLFAISSFISHLIPHFPPWVGVAAPCLFAFLTMLWAKVRGVRDGAWLLKWLILILFVFGTVFLRASNRADRLYPLLGKGLGHTLLSALHGFGSVWGIALLFVLPKTEGKTARYVIMPWILCAIWALWHGFLRPWAGGDSMAVAEKMMGLSRHAGSVTLSEMASLLWMVLLPLCVVSSLASAEVLVKRALPRCPRWLPPVLLLGIPALCILLFPEKVLLALETLLPYRALLSVLCGALMMKKGVKA